MLFIFSMETVDIATLSPEERDACHRLLIRQVCTQMPTAYLLLYQAANVHPSPEEMRTWELFQEEAQREIQKRADPDASSDEGDTDDEA